MHIIIAGGGSTGKKMLDLFKGHSQQYKITVIESNKKTCEYISEVYPYVEIVFGDATDPQILEEARTKNTAAFIGATGDDQANLLAGKAAKKMGIPEIILTVVSHKYRELAKVMELDNIINPSDSISAEIVTRLNGADFAELIHDLHLEIEFKKIVVDQWSDLKEVPVTQFEEEVAGNAYPILILRHQSYHLPSEIDIFEIGDEVIYWHKPEKKSLF
ncbi:NAD-binding protein [Natroniella sulfidigena]|uniref:potassium channel family protein n=1 Tax=Natroniella sulfidigena TaxID=723921 RepID=UPI00200B0D9F|nr:NAD-binding protein [Natroniella sulfidigena]MCK8817956.1 NAD-binding protein [Natroniella sulfidigena]